MNTTNTTSISCEGDTSLPDFWVGVFAALIGSIILNLGLNVQKYAYNTRGLHHQKSNQENNTFTVHTVAHAPPSPPSPTPLYKNKIWVLGFAVFLLGNTGDAIGLTFTPQSVITPIGSISLVSNLFFAKLLLGEKIGIRTLIAVCFIICGVIFIVVSSSNANGCGSMETMETLMVRWRQPGFVVFAIFHAFFLIVIFICVVVTEKKMIKRNAFKIASIVPAVQEQMNIHIPSLLNLTPKQRTFLRFGYPLLGSLFASWTVLLSKSVGELIKVSARQSSSNQLTYWEAWLMLIGLIVSLPCQVIYLNKGEFWKEKQDGSFLSVVFFSF